MPVWAIVLIILAAATVVLIIFGNRLRKKQAKQQDQIEAAKQVVSMLIIDKKKMKFRDAGFQQAVIDQVPKYLRGRKMPVVKVKIGPRIMTMLCDPDVYDTVPVKAQVKAEISGIYLTGIKSIRGGKAEIPKKKTLSGRMSAALKKASKTVNEQSKAADTARKKSK
ncbi:MAG: hypothetical protein ACOX78_05420 [Lachnospiraceae bacterium]